MGHTGASLIELNLVAVPTKQILYLLPHGNINYELPLAKEKNKQALCFCFLEFMCYCYFRFMFPYPLQWGPPTFSAGHSFAMMSAVIVSMVEVCLSAL